jgi:D-glycero-alpha-D-manno-heptose-7-phosphate kinase
VTSTYNLGVAIVTSAPTRIDLAGGTIDIWPLYLFHPGAQTINAAISIRARARLEPATTSGWSSDRKTPAASWTWPAGRSCATPVNCGCSRSSLTFSRREGHADDHVGIAGRRGHCRLVGAECGGVRGVCRLEAQHYEPEALLQIAMNIEAQTIKVPTVCRTTGRRSTVASPRSNWTLTASAGSPLCRSGGTREPDRPVLHGEPRNSGTNNWEITKKHIDGDPFVFDCFERIRDTAEAMRNALTPATGTPWAEPSPGSGTIASSWPLV